MTGLWKKHIELDYRYSTLHASFLEENQILLEKNSYVPGLDTILEKAWNSLDKKKLQKGDWQRVPLEASYLGSMCELKVKYWENDSVHTGGRCSFEHAEIRNDRLQKVEIEVNVAGPLTNTYLEFCRILSHELLHSYQVYQRLKKSTKALYAGEKDYRRFEARPSYNVIVDLLNDSSSKLNRVVGGMLYFTFPEERGAFLGQLRAELKPEAKELGTSKGCQEALQKTTFWKNLQLVKNNLRAISDYSKETNQKTILDAVNKAFGKGHECTTFNQAIKKLTHQVEQAERKFQNVVGKVCWELYNESVLAEGKTFIDCFVDPERLDTFEHSE